MENRLDDTTSLSWLIWFSEKTFVVTDVTRGILIFFLPRPKLIPVKVIVTGEDEINPR